MEQCSRKSIESSTTQVHSHYEKSIELVPEVVDTADSILQYLDFIETLGRGAFGTVLKARRLADD